MEILTKFKNLAELTTYFADDQSCREYLELMRWNGSPVCPHCSNGEVYKFSDGKSYKCKACRKKFTVTVGTIFEDTHIGLRKWFMAIYIFTSHKKGISSVQLGKDLGITQKSAWHLLHRIRHAFGITEPETLEGEVEIDETYIGGKAKNMHKKARAKKIQGRGASGKTAVLGMVERNGRIYVKPVQSTDSKTLQAAIKERVEEGSQIFTDEFPAYKGLEGDYAHETINHGIGNYVNGNIHTNAIESHWSMLKRGIYGIYHQVSEKHLHRYCTEFGYRHNTRKSNEVDRFDSALTFCDGRLMYKTLIGKESEAKAQ